MITRISLFLLTNDTDYGTFREVDTLMAAAEVTEMVAVNRRVAGCPGPIYYVLLTCINHHHHHAFHIQRPLSVCPLRYKVWGFLSVYLHVVCEVENVSILKLYLTWKL